MPDAYITGLGHYLPENIITNDNLSKLMDTSDKWIIDRTTKIHKSFYRRNCYGVRRNSDSPNEDYIVGFVPHDGYKYGVAFKKTYLYEDDEESPLNSRRVLTIHFEKRY